MEVSPTTCQCDVYFRKFGDILGCKKGGRGGPATTPNAKEVCIFQATSCQTRKNTQPQKQLAFISKNSTYLGTTSSPQVPGMNFWHMSRGCFAATIVIRTFVGCCSFNRLDVLRHMAHHNFGSEATGSGN